jgi:hypothetical protein
MRRSGWTPSIVPDSGDQTVYLVMDDDIWREAHARTTDLETVIFDFLDGHYPDPLRVVAFNTAEGWSRDASRDVATEVRRRADLTLTYDDLSPGVEEFIRTHAGPERQLTLGLV